MFWSTEVFRGFRPWIVAYDDSTTPLAWGEDDVLGLDLLADPHVSRPKRVLRQAWETLPCVAAASSVGEVASFSPLSFSPNLPPTGDLGLERFVLWGLRG